MKLGFFGDGPWSQLALKRLISDQHEIAFITPRYDSQDPVLKEISDKYGIEWLVSRDVNSSSFLDCLKEKNCDALVSMSFDQIIKKDLIDISPKGIINCHAGALPYYRGRNPINWAIINGEKHVGITAHFVDQGIDTGDIIQQDFIQISNADDYGTILDKSFEQCAVTLSKAIHNIETGIAKIKKQSDSDARGFYCTKRIDGDEYIDWSQSSEDIHNFIRAITYPAPGARTKSKTHDLRIFKSVLSEKLPRYKATPGEIVGNDQIYYHVKTGDSILLIEKGNIQWSSDSSARVRLKIGDRIGITYGELVEAVLGKQV